MSLRSVKRLKKDKQMHFTTLWKSRQNVLVLWFIHILKTVHLQQFKGMQSSKLGQLSSLGYVCERSSICRQQEVNERVSFSVKNGEKDRVRPLGGASPQKILCWSPELMHLWPALVLSSCSLISPRDTRNTPYLDALRTTYLFVDPVLSPSVRKKKFCAGTPITHCWLRYWRPAYGEWKPKGLVRWILYLSAEPGVPAGDQPLISTSPPLQKHQFSTSSRDQTSSPR